MDELFKIRDVSVKFGISTRTLKYYEDMGLLKSTKCNEYSYRMYDSDAIKRLEQILILRKLSIRIKDISLIFETNNTNVVLEVLTKKANDIDEEAALLHELKDIINHFIKQIKDMDFTKESDVKLLYEKTKDIELEIKNLDYQGNTSQVNKLIEVTRKLDKMRELTIANKSIYIVKSFNGGNYIDGVPVLKWGQLRDCSFAGTVKTMLDIIGLNVSYEEIMGFSGACYHIAMNKKWEPSACMPQAAYEIYAPTYNIDRALGVQGKGFDPKKRDKQIKEKIDNGIPVICLNPRVQLEWGIICGYMNDGRFFGRSYFDFIQPSEDSVFTDNRYYLADNYPGFLPQYHLGYYDINRVAPLPLEDSLKISLEIAKDMLDKKNGERYLFGFEAYNMLINDLCSDNKKFAALTPYGSTSNGFYIFSQLIDARRSAHEFWKTKHMYLSIDNSKKMQRVSALYGNMKDELLRVLPYEKISSPLNGYPKEDWSIEKRHEIADVLKKIITYENEVYSIITDVLNNW